MSAFDKLSRELEIIFGTDVFKHIINNDMLKINQLQAAISLLIKAGIDFDLSFASGTERNAPSIELIIFINPTTTINFVIALEAGASIFTGV